jgi:hypothetical protein
MATNEIVTITDEIISQLRNTNHQFPIEDYVEFVLNILLVRDGIRPACLLELTNKESHAVIDLFIRFIIRCCCIYERELGGICVMRLGTMVPNFTSSNIHNEIATFLGYPYNASDMIKNKYRYYIKVVISGHVYDLYRMVAGSKHNELARDLEYRCRTYFHEKCSDSYIIYGYSRKKSYWDMCAN